MIKKFWFQIFICLSILLISFFPGFVSGLESTHSISAILRKEVELGEGIKFDMFLRSSVTFEYPEKVEAGENITGSFVFNPATIMIFLDIPSINQTYVTENEIPLEDSKPVTVFDGVTLVIDLQPTTKLSASGPLEFNQTNIVWENFLEKQSYEASIFANASSKEKIIMNLKFYLDAQISVYIQLQNYSSEIVSNPIPQIEMSPQISRVVDVESTTTIIDTLGNPIFLLTFAAITTLIIVSLLTIKIVSRKKVKKEISGTINKQKEVIIKDNHSQKTNNFIYCLYCGEQLPTEALYCRKCGKKTK